jgi:hypothetical protein
VFTLVERPAKSFQIVAVYSSVSINAAASCVKPRPCLAWRRVFYKDPVSGVWSLTAPYSPMPESDHALIEPRPCHRTPSAWMRFCTPLGDRRRWQHQGNDPQAWRLCHRVRQRRRGEGSRPTSNPMPRSSAGGLAPLHHVPGRPRATPDVVLAVIDAEAPPLRFFVGSTGLPRVRDAYQGRLRSGTVGRALRFRTGSADEESCLSEQSGCRLRDDVI